MGPASMIVQLVALLIHIHFATSQQSQVPLAGSVLDLISNNVINATSDQTHAFSATKTKRVAIIGAGSAGSSTAYFLRQFTASHESQLNITIYERESYIGGRSTTVNAWADPSEPIELGASIFVKVNRNLVNAANAFNLNTTSFSKRSLDAGDDDDVQTLGVWDGHSFVVTQTMGVKGLASWWSTAKLLWRYGLAPIRTVRLMKEVVGKFLHMYDAPIFPFSTLTQAVFAAGLEGVTTVTGEKFLGDNGVTGLFADEIVQASTRVNYAQNLRAIHGLEAIVCMATNGAMSIQGGNWQIFDGMVNSSLAYLRLDTAVTKIAQKEKGGYEVSTSSGDSDTFDAVVLAAPYQFTNITLEPEEISKPEEIPYVKLHVTLFASPHKLWPLAFNLPSNSDIPEVILTTLPKDYHPSTSNDVGPAGFFSISTLRTGWNRKVDPPRREYIYKIFSPEPIDNAFLSRHLGIELTNPPSDDDVSWLYRKVWHSYPYEVPRIKFEDVQLDSGLWYTSSIESFISTMETSSLMGMNVARLIADEWQSIDESHKKAHEQ